MTALQGPVVPVTMRAARLHEVAGELVISVDDDVPTPACGDDEVLVKVRNSGLNQVDSLTQAGQTASGGDTPAHLWD